MALQPWRKGKVIRIDDHTPGTKRFFIEVLDTASFEFIPGQFVTLDLPIHEKVNKRLRSYSISSWPDKSNVFELIIVYMEGGAGTHYLFNEIKVDSEITFRGPQGVFVLKEDDLQKDIFLICTGTGIAPFRSMAQSIKLNNILHKNVYLLFGTRTKNDLLYFDELSQLQKDLPGFHYLPVLSREDWDGRKGYVHTIYEDLCAGKQPAGFFLCGWKNMIDEAKKRIIDLGYDKKAIHQELYG